MECNKEEAVRAKESAEKKMDIKDYMGARTMVLKAQKLYPGIENASQMLTVCEVHCCAEGKKVGMEPDWYGILQIGQAADEASIKKQFRKLALQLHPDKNKFPGAEAAFKLIDDAQRILCNQSERSKFDDKLKTMRSGQQRQSSKQPKPSGTKNRKRGRKSDSEEETDSIETESSCDMEEEGDHKAGQNPGLSIGRGTRRSSRQKHPSISNLSDDDDIASRSRRKTTKINESTLGGNSEEVAEDDGNFEGVEPVVLEVADPDFYEFDRDKSEECFASDQMWAIFDDLDGMPRFYARIKKVYSPFKVDITWLEFVAGDMGETAWKRSGLPVSCGKFKHDKTDTIEDIGIFSHKIIWDKGARNTYKIYPRKGETWALYKNWNSKWSSDPDNHREYEYEFVVVLSDYTNESGILVTQLVKLKGFVCLFKPTKTNGMSSFQIASNEMLKFSHRVPSFRTGGRERKDVPEGYFELDPASLPSNLEQVFDHIDGNAETVSGQINGSLKSISEEKPHMPKNGVTAKAESKILTTPDGVTAMEHRVPEQIPSSPTSAIDPGFKY
ncbi:hypothetical protein MKW92_004900 [Papaver armeniacum]|nr:hypothetical protein MKW92_004900 [Papaver armeniacum]